MTLAWGPPSRWTAADIGDQTGRTVPVTGANSGLGRACADPAPARRSAAARDGSPAARLWDLTGSETGVTPDPGA